MENFSFLCPTKILFGKNTETLAGRETGHFGKKALLHYGGGSIKRSGLYERVVRSLAQAGVEWVELAGAKPNPRLSLVYEGIEFCRENRVDFILAVGGGSVIDSAKAIAVGVPYEGDVWDFYTGKASPERALPTGVVLTIPAAGSEASKSSVITNEEGWYKRALDNDLLSPKFAILNPEVTYTLPREQTVYGASDIMAHIMERYFTNAKGVDFTDRLCEAAFRTIINNVPAVLDRQDDYAARAEIMWVGTLVHNDLLNTGRIGDWASHAIEHELSGMYDVPHGAGMSVIFPAWMKYVFRKNTDRFEQFARRIWDVDLAYEDREKVVLEGIARLTVFYRRIGLPVSLGELGIHDGKLEEMARKCTEKGTVGNFTALEESDVLNILKLAAKG